jgi:predicted Abi (CAAX) family protease
LLEELVFRVLLLPAPNPDAPFRQYAPSIALFMLWHPLQIAIFGEQWAHVVLNPAFLIAVAALGFALTRLYLATRSIWPSVIVHWLVVVIWKAMGGPSPWG